MTVALRWRKAAIIFAESRSFVHYSLKKVLVLRSGDWRWFSRANGWVWSSNILVKFTIIYTLMLMVLMKITFAYNTIKRVFRNIISFEPQTRWAQHCSHSHYPSFWDEGAEAQGDPVICLRYIILIHNCNSNHISSILFPSKAYCIINCLEQNKLSFFNVKKKQ